MKRHVVPMTFTLVAVTLAATAAQPAPQADAGERIKQRLVGSYRLVSWTSYNANGEAARSPYTLGQISYDASGRMAAHLMTAERQKLAATGRAQPSSQTRETPQRGQQAPQGRGAAGQNTTGYISYYGRFEIDAAKGIVTHHVEGSTNLGMIGTAQVRYFELAPDGRTLFLSTKSGERVTGRLQWERH